MKKISVVVPCYNEEDNIKPICQSLTDMFSKDLSDYDYEVIFIDNHSLDKTKELVKDICKSNSHFKAIFNIRNFGPFSSPYYGILQATGDCTVLMACDFQDPVEMIPKFVKEWEDGNKIVVGVKTKSQENKFIYALRSIYYGLIQKLSNVEMIRHFTGFALYDKDFVEILRSLDDSTPFLRGIVAEYGYKIKELEFEQPKRTKGKTHNSFSTLYDGAMLSFTSYTTLGLRIVTLVGFIIGIFSFIIGLVYLILKLRNWYTFHAGTAPILIGVFFLGSLQLFTLGLIGEYAISIHRRAMKRPLVIEEERINFKNEKE